jgi:hypothetical protein
MLPQSNRTLRETRRPLGQAVFVNFMKFRTEPLCTIRHVHDVGVHISCYRRETHLVLRVVAEFSGLRFWDTRALLCFVNFAGVFGTCFEF